VCQIDETGVAADAVDVGCRDSLFVQGFDHGPDVKFALCLPTDTGCHWIIQVTAHPVPRISGLPTCRDRLSLVSVSLQAVRGEEREEASTIAHVMLEIQV
jgi:hypothetical protein